MPENSIRVVAHVTAKPDKINETREILTSLVHATRTEDGCVTYELLQNTEDPTDFTFVEEWVNGDALDAHFQTDHFVAAQKSVADLLAAPPDIRRYVLIR